MEGKFWDIRAQGKEASIDIFGVIGDYGMWEESVSATNFIRELRSLGRVSRLNINLHSEGGSVFDGLAIYRALRDFQAEKVVHVSSLAASIATVVMLAGDRIEVAPEASGMIHNPWGMAIGGEAEMQAYAAQLKQAKSQILNIYERRTGADRDHLSDLMDRETWFASGEELKEAGFADVVKEDKTVSRIAAGPLKLAKFWRHAPESVLKRKPQPLAPEIAARMERLRLVTE